MSAENSSKEHKDKALSQDVVTCCKKMRITSDEVWEAKLYLPLFLIIWIPQTIAVIATLYYHIRWQYFGITEGISPFYTNRFATSWDSYMWIIGEIGWVGMGLFCILAIAYLWLTRKIVVAFFYCR